MSIELTIKLKMGPTTINYKAEPGSELYWTDEAEFLQKVMELMKYVGTEDDVPEDPRPAVAEHSYMPGTTFFQPQADPGYTINNVSAFPVTTGTDVEEEFDEEDEEGYGGLFYQDEDAAPESPGGPEGDSVARVAPVRPVRMS